MKPYLILILMLFCFTCYGQMSKKEAKNYLGHFDFATFETDSGIVHKITTAKEANISLILLEYSTDGTQWTKVQEIQPAFKNSGYFEQNEYVAKTTSTGIYRVSIYSKENKLVDFRQNKI